MDEIRNLGRKSLFVKLLFGLLAFGLSIAVIGNSSAFVTGSTLNSSKTGNYGINPRSNLDPNQRSLSQTPRYIPAQIIVKLKKGRALSNIQGLNQKYRVKATRNLFQKQPGLNRLQTASPQLTARLEARQKKAPKGKVVPNLDNILVLDLPGDTTDLASIIKQYQADPNVEYVEPNYTYEIQMLPNDPYYSSQNSWGQGYDDLWGLKQIQAERAWDLSQGAGVVVAVVDTGIDYRHEDISVNCWTNPGEIAGNGIDDDGNGYVDDVYGYDFCNTDPDPRDDNGHGTHVAGTIAAVSNNSLGIIGVAPQAKVMAVKGLNATGSGRSDVLASCIRYAADNGADVLNASWGSSFSSQAIEDAINYAVAKGCVVVAAAGNSNQDVAGAYPASLDQVIAVAATSYDRTKCSFSNWGNKIEVAAPGGAGSGSGGNILSLLADNSDIIRTNPELIVGNHYLRLQGTSMASPHVAGLAALLLSYFPQATVNDIRGRIMATTDPVASNPGSEESPYIGTGIINAYNALTAVERPCIRIEQVDLAEAQGDGDGIIESQESAQLTVHLKNLWNNATAVTATLSSSSPYVASISNPVSDFGAIGQFQTANNTGAPFIFQTNQIEGETPLEFILNINVDGIIQTQRIRGYAGLKKLVADKICLSPAISGNNLIWVGQKDFERDIYCYDLQNNREVNLTSAMDSNPDNPDIYGTKVVWQDYLGPIYYNSDIYCYDLGANQLRQITNNPANQSSPSISGNRIVWLDERNKGFDVYLYDLEQNQETRITNYTRNVILRPKISGNQIVWTEGLNIIHYVLTTKQERVIVSSAAQKWLSSFYGSKIFWYEDRDSTGNYQIYSYDLRLNQERRLTSEPWDHYQPYICGNRVVWCENKDGNEDVYLYDLITGQKTRITMEESIQSAPVINDHWIFWLDNRESQVWLSIYGVSILSVATPPPAPVISEPLFISNSKLQASWTCLDSVYEIIEYQYAIGSEPGATDICNWTSAGASSSITQTDLNLTFGCAYYLSVKAKNDAGLWSEIACCSGIAMDMPPKIDFVNDGIGPDLKFSAEPGKLCANWAPSTGGVSGVKNYWYAIGTTPGGTDVLDWTNNGLNLSVTQTGLNLIQNQTYYFAVKVENNAGYQSVPAFSNGQTVDLTPPVINNLIFNISVSIIHIIPLGDSGPINDQIILSASWFSSSDPESGIKRYLYAIGTSPGSNDLVDWTDNGKATFVQRNDLSFTPSSTYYCTVKAENNAGLSNIAISNGRIFDPSPPSNIAMVNDGSSQDVAFTTYSDRLTANWTAASDPDSGISQYTYCVGTAPGSENVIRCTDNGPNTSVTCTGLNLVNGTTYYFSVIAYNGTGFKSQMATSNGQTVDTTPPALITTVNDSSGADSQFTRYSTQLAANWTPSADPESGVVKYYYAIGTAPGLTDVKGWTDNGLKTTAGRTGLNLTHGVTYYISVKAINGAGLDSGISASNGQTVDTTPPALISTVNDGSGADSQFTRFTTQLSANWTPSADPESGVNKYFYAIGTAPGLTDVKGWTDNGLKTTAGRTDLNLTHGVTYYFSVKAVNGAGVFSEITSSNGQMVDATPPLPVSVVNDGSTIGVDIDTTTSSAQLSANWAATMDTESYVIAYFYAIGTAPGLNDVVDWTNNGLNTKFTKTGLSLAGGQTYYVSVKAMNVMGGMSTVTSSNGQTMVDEG
ncbi:MAG TPA: S8 family serine peptidase [Bacillota bacterium]|nr:S8 family serine peptidase [Bacillota bacterium]